MRERIRTIPYKDYTVYTASWDDPRGSGYYHPPTILNYRGNECVIGAGQTDDITLFKPADDDGTIFILVTNDRYGYIGLSWAKHNLKTGEHDIVFFQSPDDELTGIPGLKKSIFDYSQINQVKILAENWVFGD